MTVTIDVEVAGHALERLRDLVERLRQAREDVLDVRSRATTDTWSTVDVVRDVVRAESLELDVLAMRLGEARTAVQAAHDELERAVQAHMEVDERTSQHFTSLLTDPTIEVPA